MTITVRGIGAMTASTSNDQTVGLPSGHAANDINLLFMAEWITGGTTFSSTGYTSQTTHAYTPATPDQNAALFYKIDGGSETDPTMHVSVAPGSGMYGLLFGVTGVDTTTPFDTVTPVWTDMASVTTDSGPPSGVTSITANALAVCMVFYDKDSRWDFKSGSDQGFTMDTTPLASYSTTTGNDGGLLVCHKAIVAAGLVTFPSFAPTQNSPSTGLGVTFVLRAAGTAASEARRHLPRGVNRGVARGVSSG